MTQLTLTEALRVALNVIPQLALFFFVLLLSTDFVSSELSITNATTYTNSSTREITAVVP